MSKKNEMPLEGEGRHSGRQHPKAEAVKTAKLNPAPQESAHGARKTATGDSKYGKN